MSNEIQDEIGTKNEKSGFLQVNESGGAHPQDFKPWKQTFKILGSVLLDFLGSAILWGAFLGLLIFTQNQGVLTQQQKYLFNVVVTGIPLLLGLQTVRAYKKIANTLRWRILASGPYPPKEIDLILGVGSYTTVFSLFLSWFSSHPGRPPHRGRAILCLLWIILNVGSQVAFGMLGFVFDMQGNGALLSVPGVANYTLLDHYYFANHNSTAPTTSDIANEQYLAHLFGDISADLYQNATSLTPFPKDPEELNPSYGKVKTYKVDGTTDWVYRFQDWTAENPADAVDERYEVLSVVSERSVRIQTNCARYSVALWRIIGMGSNRTTDIWDTGDTEWSMFGPGDASFLNPDFNPVSAPPNGTMGRSEALCGGLRCAAIGVYIITDFTGGVGTFYECNITVSTVDHVGALPEFRQMSDKVARLAAGSIGLDGIIYDNKGGHVRSQFARYNNDTLWGMEAIYSNDARKVESLVGGFAAGSIATLDIRNPRVQASGLRQVQHGVKVTVKVNYIFIILGLVLGIHLLILIPIVVGYSHGFLPGDESFLDIGVLLKPITNDPESSGREYRYANTPSLVPSARV